MDRVAYIQSLQLKLTDEPLTEKQLKDFASRSRAKLWDSPAQVSVRNDLAAMQKQHLEQVLALPRLGLFTKDYARLELQKR